MVWNTFIKNLSLVANSNLIYICPDFFSQNLWNLGSILLNCSHDGLCHSYKMRLFLIKKKNNKVSALVSLVATEGVVGIVWVL